MRVSFPFLVAVGAAATLLVLVISNAILPPDTARLVDVRIWLVARATGITAYLLLAAQVAVGLVMSHPTNLSTWKISKRAFPYHEHLAVFTLAFLAIHVVLLSIDRYADVGVVGALVPGMSGYRPPAVAVGTIALYSLLITAISARWTRLLPRGAWLKVHRLSAIAFALAWSHAVVAGTDSEALKVMYLGTGLLILALVAHRWWVVRIRPTRAPRRAPAARIAHDDAGTVTPERIPVAVEVAPSQRTGR
ncbi:MAG TPA: ferric reductase-like transmembrane domain-containing protein [Candidatus Limnocylindrales bacterium]|nr:ferric reductase-like transmembrane domain-containing protein [Candidatus Limnocylindrales bacterium]